MLYLDETNLQEFVDVKVVPRATNLPRKDFELPSQELKNDLGRLDILFQLHSTGTVSETVRDNIKQSQLQLLKKLKQLPKGTIVFSEIVDRTFNDPNRKDPDNKEIISNIKSAFWGLPKDVQSMSDAQFELLNKYGAPLVSFVLGHAAEVRPSINRMDKDLFDKIVNNQVKKFSTHEAAIINDPVTRFALFDGRDQATADELAKLRKHTDAPFVMVCSGPHGATAEAIQRVGFEVRDQPAPMSGDDVETQLAIEKLLAQDRKLPFATRRAQALSYLNLRAQK